MKIKSNQVLFLCLIFITACPLLFLVSCKKSGPSEPAANTATVTATGTPVYTHTITATTSVTETATETATATDTGTETPTATQTQLPAGIIDNFEDGNMYNLIMNDTAYNEWYYGVGGGGSIDNYGTVAASGGIYGSYSGYVSGTAATTSGGPGDYRGSFVIGAYTYLQIGISGHDFTAYNDLHFSAALLASAPAGVTYEIKIQIFDLNYNYIEYTMPVVPGSAMEEFTVNKSAFFPQGAYTVNEVLGDTIIVQWVISAKSANYNDVATIGLFLDNVYWQ